ncbi:MAG: hypothetical protein NVSMB38_38010 [Ktedonobacteraceae bacterium]
MRRVQFPSSPFGHCFCPASLPSRYWPKGSQTREVITPKWTGPECYVLQEPWFIYDGYRLRAWQLVMTLAAFKTRSIYGGDRMLDRV